MSDLHIHGMRVFGEGLYRVFFATQYGSMIIVLVALLLLIVIGIARTSLNRSA